ncbi:hypothetical protein RPD_3094 [Rhodopseudomonas palustris BisB5]|uniref:Uncharacterized protein n=1 Tax=Rhodopseudomonas palustris (strain BisB5) TaxID=316057 RepID=Q135B9_RHOPS|nr:hypothetical protein RPD_3094 [Rhodopseudomonas palustris BisB5]
MFIPDGLRALTVTPETAPAMAALRDQGVNLAVRPGILVARSGRQPAQPRRQSEQHHARQ